VNCKLTNLNTIEFTSANCTDKVLDLIFVQREAISLLGDQADDVQNTTAACTLQYATHDNHSQRKVKFIKQQRSWRPLTCYILDTIVKYIQNVLAFKSTNDITNS